ncbi:MAG: hypothetical protein NTZ67_02205 [Gammaproteobacteria bacterium]|nr:hypothetical protein [Gammaproteobacteria bacterium]
MSKAALSDKKGNPILNVEAQGAKVVFTTPGGGQPSKDQLRAMGVSNAVIPGNPQKNPNNFFTHANTNVQDAAKSANAAARRDLKQQYRRFN